MELLANYENEVSLKYQVYNSIFLTLGLTGIKKIGIQLPLLAQACKNGFESGKSPEEIITEFFEHAGKDQDILDSLFGFVQFIERQIVLIDALEDAAYSKIHDLQGSGSYHHFAKKLSTHNQSI